jgi:hypothetical protein
MENRERLWTDMHESYLGRKPYSLVPLKDRLAAICLTLRDAPWATGLFPTWSMAQLGIATSPDYRDWRRRSVQFSCDKQRRLVVSFIVGSRAKASEVLPGAGSEEELQRLAAWLRSDEPAP